MATSNTTLTTVTPAPWIFANLLIEEPVRSRVGREQVFMMLYKHGSGTYGQVHPEVAAHNAVSLKENQGPVISCFDSWMTSRKGDTTPVSVIVYTHITGNTRRTWVLTRELYEQRLADAAEPGMDLSAIRERVAEVTRKQEAAERQREAKQRIEAEQQAQAARLNR